MEKKSGLIKVKSVFITNVRTNIKYVLSIIQEKSVPIRNLFLSNVN